MCESIRVLKWFSGLKMWARGWVMSHLTINLRNRSGLFATRRRSSPAAAYVGTKSGDPEGMGLPNPILRSHDLLPYGCLVSAARCRHAKGTRGQAVVSISGANDAVEGQGGLSLMSASDYALWAHSCLYVEYLRKPGPVHTALWEEMKRAMTRRRKISDTRYQQLLICWHRKRKQSMPW